MKFSMTCAVTLLAAVCAPAALMAQDNAKSGTEETAEHDTSDPMKCKYTHTVDSKIAKRVCMPESHWKRLEEETREDRRGSKNRNSYCSDTGPC